MANPAAAAVLDDIRVLDFTAVMSGPYCTRLMADIGAEVIKVEPLEGDLIRLRPPLRNGRSISFAQLNAGKRSICLDLKKPEARELIEALVPLCDVVVENYRPGVMKRLGLDYAALSRLNPRLVYCSIAGVAPGLHATSGEDMASFDYHEGEVGQPLNNGSFVADVLGGSIAFGAIQAALLRAVKTGQGEQVDVSPLDAMLGLLVYQCQEVEFPPQRRHRLHRPTAAKDGFLLIAPVSQSHFEALARAVGHTEWVTDARFATTSEREDNWSEFMHLLDGWAGSRTAAECEAVLNGAGVQCSRYPTSHDTMHVHQRGVLETIDDGAGPVCVPNPAFRFRNSAAHARNKVPRLGSDGPRVLADLLGYDLHRIAELVQKGILGAEEKRYP